MRRTTTLNTRLRGEVATHTIARIFSGVLSLYLFALIARLYSTNDVKDLYFFLLIFGFAVSALRTLTNVSASLQATHSKSRRLRHIQSASGEVLFAALLVVPVTIWLLEQHVSNPTLLVCSAVLLVGAAVDSDPIRALVDRSARFAAAFALGSTLAVSWLLVMAPGPKEYAVIAILLQFVPVALLNFISLMRTGADSLSAGVVRLRANTGSVVTLFIVAVFDGLILNLLFLLGWRAPVDAGIDVAIVIRVFSASLVMFPLFLHWSNSSALARLASRARITVPVIFFSLQVGSAVVCGLLFGVAYAWVSDQHLGFSQLSMFIALVVAFCLYTTAARFGGRAASARLLAPVLGAVAMTTIAAALFMMARPTFHALVFTALQCTALVLGALAIHVTARLARLDAIEPKRLYL